MWAARACTCKPAAAVKPYRGATGWIYVAEAAGGLVKIGWSRDPYERVRRLESTFGSMFIHGAFIGTPADEVAAHARWSHLHVEGEWFRTEEELLTWAEGLVVA